MKHGVRSDRVVQNDTVSDSLRSYSFEVYCQTGQSHHKRPISHTESTVLYTFKVQAFFNSLEIKFIEHLLRDFCARVEEFKVWSSWVEGAERWKDAVALVACGGEAPRSPATGVVLLIGIVVFESPGMTVYDSPVGIRCLTLATGGTSTIRGPLAVALFQRRLLRRVPHTGFRTTAHYCERSRQQRCESQPLHSIPSIETIQ
ncbi:hypothetical protein UL81_04245 [Corynebacterium camporealensis]|uniref:Uncharacterized protein n=1 Tax=Corynebacterium camporealensis TaxID=161896 RepID=A0A0F6QVG0_9CORY|nr:hypothetical protein UL81_04245 [Corynebacterium camporealensis]